MIFYSLQEQSIHLLQFDRSKLMKQANDEFLNINKRITIIRMERGVLSNTKSTRIMTLAILLLNLLAIIGCIQAQTHEYPLADEYFDRIYKIQDHDGEKFLHIHCKQANMMSISITKQMQYKEHPRFPTYPSWKQAPNFQRKFYTFLDACGLDVVINNKQCLVELKRKSDGVSVFKLNSYLYKQVDYIEVNTSDNSKKWGLGERFQKHFAVKDGSWTIWNRDRPWEIDQGSPVSSKQTYGHQPVYLARQNEGQHKYHLVYFKNTYGMNVDISNNANNLKYSVVGGNIQFIVLIGQKPEQVLEQYHRYIGPAHVPPFWSLGYHQCRWGYKTYEQFAGVVDEFASNKLPLDTMWSDLDYMNAKAIFTVDEGKYPSHKMKKLIEEKQIHYIPLIDVGVSIEDKVAMQKGKASDVFLKNPQHNSDYVATVWPGKVHFVDYLHPNASEFWESQLDRLHQLIPFSGVWLDMNEPSNFNGNQHVFESYPIQRRESINMMTINVDIDHYSSTNEALKQKQVHAYFGHFSTIPTHNFLKKHGRPFIISRSNSVGTGAYAGHWTGDNVANWDFLRLSISGNFLFQIFGIQMVGADICGFHQNTNEELCSRWMQVGSFYPFARNHNENQSISQEPYRFGNDLLEATRNSFNQRYSLLKQMYSTLVLLNGTGSYYRPMFFEFDQDQKAVGDQESETQFMIGNYLMGAPIVEAGKRNRDVYFPGNQSWYELSFRPDTGFNHNQPLRIHKGGQTQNVANQRNSAPPTFLRAGKLLFTTAPKLRTKYLDSNFTLYVPLSQGKAEGDILGIGDYNNQTQISGCLAQGCRLHVTVEKIGNEKCILSWSYEGEFPYRANLVIENIRVFDQMDQLASLGSAITISKPSGSQEFKIRLI